ncbi:MAG: heme-binding protein, partial [Gammaproteobacteria bacterium]|nr:heme-binding protein [Gammaproteobacteria bacterium]
PHRSPLGLAADPGGIPLYKAGTPVGGVGVISDAGYSFDADIADTDSDDDELIAIAASFGFAAPADRRADRIAVDGRLLRFADGRDSDLQSSPAAAPAFSSINNIAGTLLAVPGYVAAAIDAGLPFGHPASGIRPDTLDFPGLDAFVLVDAGNVERFRPMAGTDGAGALTALEVQTILGEALQLANRSRAQIRQPAGMPARVSIAVVDSNGVILGIVRSRDAPVFGLDVALQKARTATFFSSAAAAAALSAVPAATYLNGGLVVLRDEPLAQYVNAAQTFLGLPTALTDGAIAFSDRAGGNLSRPFFPDGVTGNPAGPFSKPAGEWSPFSTGLQLDLVYNALVQHIGFTLSLAADVPANCTGIDGFNDGFAISGAIAQLANGTQIFPGSVPVYRGTQLVGGIGVSGDGVDQDDMIAFLGLHRAGIALGGIGNADQPMRADTLTPQGTRLRYVNCPITPFIDNDEQNVCEDK